MRRVAPALALFLIAPLVAEFLLGDLSITMLPALVVLAPMYGGGALLVREVVRRAGRGWPSIVVLGLAYAVFEEAFTTQSLFNPNYLGLGLHLLEPAHVAVLGIGLWWTVFVLTLHTAWSIATSVALAEALVPGRAESPWLGRFGLGVACASFAFGAIATTLITFRSDRFLAPLPRLAGAALVLATLVVAAFRLRRRLEPGGKEGSAPGPWWIGASSLLAGSAFLLVPPSWGWWAAAADLALDVAMVVAVLRWSRRPGWGRRHQLGLAGGAALAYAWHAFPQQPVAGRGGTVDLAGNAFFALGLVALLAWAGIRPARPTGTSR
jgi:hypothetical protein